MKRISKVAILMIAATVTTSLVFNACSIHPVSWRPPVKNEFKGVTALNEELTTTQKISLNGWYGPEDIVFDSMGNMYTGVHKKENDFSIGAILKIDTTGKTEVFYNAGSWVAGLHFDANKNLIALSHKEGLISISPDKRVSILASTDENGKPFLIPNGLDIASDGKVYFSNTSEKSAYNINYGRKIILEMIPLGGFYCYDPASKKVKTLINGTYFGNGVVLSKDESYVLMVETAKYRILRYWLKGDKAGQTDTFIDNLPGFPNGISIREDGSYWLGFSTKRSDDLDKIHPKPGMKRLVYALPNILQPKAEKFGMVMNISADGRILRTLFDTKGTIMPEAGAVKEHNSYLYLGGDVVPHIGKYKLGDTTKHSTEESQESAKRSPILHDSSYKALKNEFGRNKEYPAEYEEQILTALSHFSELKDTKIIWEIKETYTPLSTKPEIKTVLKRKDRRSYVITISNKTIDTLKHLLYANLSFDEQVGIMGHELSHVLDFKSKNLLQSFVNLISHLNPKIIDKMEFKTDMICIQHGLGNQLMAYSSHVRRAMHVHNWRGVDYVLESNDHLERYMNPSTIENYMKQYSLN
jgi:sugar lactone lactonase YvrE